MQNLYCNREAEFQLGLYQHHNSNHAFETPSRNADHCETEYIKQEPLDIKTELVEFDGTENKLSEVPLFKHLKSCEKLPQGTSICGIQTKLFKSSDCELKAKGEATLKEHQIHKHRADTNIKWFECSHCKYKVKQNPTLNQWRDCEYKAKHEATSTRHRNNKQIDDANLKWLECPGCEFITKKVASLERHRIKKHVSDPNIKWFDCPDCGFSTKRFAYLERHWIGKHVSGPNIKWFECTDCRYKAKQMTDLKHHQIKKHATDSDIKDHLQRHADLRINIKRRFKAIVANVLPIETMQSSST